MKHELSILIPIYNDDCREMVKALSCQAEAIDGLKYEIIVADDGSDESYIITNSQISALPNVRFIRREQNVGRAAIRNFLCCESKYEWALFLDGDMTIVSNSFIKSYLDADVKEVAYGGYCVGPGEASCLRFIYEKACEPMHRAEERRKRPFQNFHTSNFMIRRDIMLSHPLDERFRHYGYEDVLWGKQLHKAGITIIHLDNPTGFYDFEDNAHFVSKTEEGLRTLYTFRKELRGYSRLLTFIEGLHSGATCWAIKLWHWAFGSLERRNLCGKHPNLSIFKLYKLGYYLTYSKNH